MEYLDLLWSMGSTHIFFFLGSESGLCPVVLPSWRPLRAPAARWSCEGSGIHLLDRPLLSFKRLKCAEDLYLYLKGKQYTGSGSGGGSGNIMGYGESRFMQRENKINVHFIDFPLACVGAVCCLLMDAVARPSTALSPLSLVSCLPPGTPGTPALPGYPMPCALWRSFVACPKNGESEWLNWAAQRLRLIHLPVDWYLCESVEAEQLGLSGRHPSSSGSPLGLYVKPYLCCLL